MAARLLLGLLPQAADGGPHSHGRRSAARGLGRGGEHTGDEDGEGQRKVAVPHARNERPMGSSQPCGRACRHSRLTRDTCTASILLHMPRCCIKCEIVRSASAWSASSGMLLRSRRLPPIPAASCPAQARAVVSLEHVRAASLGLLAGLALPDANHLALHGELRQRGRQQGGWDAMHTGGS